MDIGNISRDGTDLTITFTDMPISVEIDALGGTIQEAISALLEYLNAQIELNDLPDDIPNASLRVALAFDLEAQALFSQSKECSVICSQVIQGAIDPKTTKYNDLAYE